jgi:hypothetical protein
MARFGPRLDLQDIINAREAVANLLHGREHSMIVDLSGVEELALSTADLHAIARMEPLSNSARIIVAPDPVIFGSARTVELLRDEKENRFQVVSELREAYSMLGLTSPDFEPLVCEGF